jgi:hypothetical protein
MLVQKSHRENHIGVIENASVLLLKLNQYAKDKQVINNTYFASDGVLRSIGSAKCFRNKSAMVYILENASV